VAALPPGQRAAAALFYLAGLGHAEIADELGISLAAVKTRLHKARASLRGSLADLREEPLAMTERIAARVVDVRRSADHHVVILEAGAERLPIWVGTPEGTALAILLEDVELPRPHTHQFAASLLHAAGARVAEVRVSRLLSTIFYATVVLGDGTEVDARPSDALALALVEDAPIFVERTVLDSAAESEIPGELAAVLDSPADARVIAEETRARLAELPRP
jgi:bifunctional DNase/RNase